MKLDVPDDYVPLLTTALEHHYECQPAERGRRVELLRHRNKTDGALVKPVYQPYPSAPLF
jgi:hypothetical protein